VGLIQDADEVYVSAVTAWEIAIKTGIGKMRARGKVAVAIAEYGFSPLPISVVHADAVPALPPHHKDPFDRLLIAQAEAEALTLVTRDPLFRRYGARVRWD
jgi:PIN domain nuclease of toxin-antitoxin system